MFTFTDRLLVFPAASVQGFGLAVYLFAKFNRDFLAVLISKSAIFQVLLSKDDNSAQQ